MILDQNGTAKKVSNLFLCLYILFRKSCKLNVFQKRKNEHAIRFLPRLAERNIIIFLGSITVNRNI